MTMLVTGAGLIAAHAAREFLMHGQDVVVYDVAPSKDYLGTVFDVSQAHLYSGDVTNLPDLVHVALQHDVHCILHTAALIGARVSSQPYHGVAVNVNGSATVMEAARLAGVRRLVNCSSVAIYGLDCLAEGESITESSPVGPKNLYGATKLASEYLLDQYGAIFGVEVIHLRLAGTFGRGQFFAGSWMGRKLNRLLLSALTGKEETLQPEWFGTQEYVYVKDAARAAALACLEPKSIGGAYNIGTGVLHTYKDVAEEIKRVAPAAAIRIAEAAAVIPPYLIRTQAFDISKARAILGFDPRYSFRAGLQDYLDELREHAGQYSALD